MENLKQTDNEVLATILKQTEDDLGSLMPAVRERIMRRMRLAYWSGVADALVTGAESHQQP